MGEMGMVSYISEEEQSKNDEKAKRRKIDEIREAMVRF